MCHKIQFSNLICCRTRGIIRIPDRIIWKQLHQQPGEGERWCWLLWFNSGLFCFSWWLGSGLSLGGKHVVNQPLAAGRTYCDCRWKAEARKRRVTSLIFIIKVTLVVLSFCKLICRWVAVYFLCDSQQLAWSVCENLTLSRHQSSYRTASLLNTN